MITTIVDMANNQALSVSVSGHANYAEKGKDIVCAGASALCMSLLSVIKNCIFSDEKDMYDYKISDGAFSLKAVLPNSKSKKAMLKAVFLMFSMGMTELSEGYPDNINACLSRLG